MSILTPVGDLFSDAAATRAHAVAPLPHRVRPRTLDELVGQRGGARGGDGSPPRDRGGHGALDDPPRPAGRRQDDDRTHRRGSVVAAFEELSAVSARVDDVRAVLARARDRLGGNDVRTLLFIDEIHRFDKRQQDSVLHAVEDGLVTLIGATTENPYFEVNQALLSRCTVIELQPLTVEELGRCSPAAPRSSARTCRATCARRSRDAPAGTRARRCRRSSSPGRRRPPRASRSRSPTSTTSRASGRSATTAPGDRHYDLASAFIKSMRGSDPDAAVYYLAAMLEGGEDARFLARRIVIAASEDVGNADPRALARRRSRRAGGRARRPARGAAEPRSGRDLRRARAEVERLRAGDLACA